MRKLMGHLAQYATFFKQGELLCTQSLTYLLKNNQAQQVFARFLSAALGTSIPETLFWRAEYVQDDGGRPDVEGCLLDGGAPVIKIEGKLGATFGEGQLESYNAALCKNGCPGSLVLLIPQDRYSEALEFAVSQFGLHGDPPWQVQDVSFAVISWEDLFQHLEAVTDQEFRENLSQFQAMYRTLNGDDMEPLTTDEQVLSWRKNEDWWKKLIDLTTRRLSPPDSKVFPLFLEKSSLPSQPYLLRYVGPKISGSESYYSLGIRDPFENHSTPIWLRFHRDTGYFQAIARQLERSELASEFVQSSGHIWIPLEVPLYAERNVMINALVTQVTRITNVAYSFA